MGLPEWLACAGIAAVGYWPGTVGSPTQLIVVATCLLPMGVRTLLRWQAVAALPAGPTTSSSTAHEPHRRSFDHALVGLAILADAPGGAVVQRANRALREMLGGDVTGRRWSELVAPEHRAAAEHAVVGLVTGELTTWRGELAHTVLDSAGETRRLHVSLVPTGTDNDAADSVSLISLQAIDVTRSRHDQQRLRAQIRAERARPDQARGDGSNDLAETG